MKSNSLIALFSINPGSGVPIYRQLVDQVKQSVRMSLIKPGDQLPSVRSLAKSLQINPMTISKAFAQLEVEGVLQRKRGVGMIVSEQHADLRIPEKVERRLKKFVTAARELNIDDENIVILVQQHLSINSED